MAWLDDNPPVRPQFRSARRAAETGCCVVHTAESTPDYVAFDGGAEAVANFIRNRPDPGSYHELADSDSRVQLVRDAAEAFGDGTGSNAWAWHLSIATRADVWPWAPLQWRDGAVEQAARAAADYAHRLHARTGVIIPAVRITRIESESGVPGFISHGDRDPARRHDPGAEFPWDAFLARFAQLTADLRGDPVSSEESDMARIIQHPNGTQALVGPGPGMTVLRSTTETEALLADGSAQGDVLRLPDPLIWDTRVTVAKRAGVYFG